MKKIITFSLLSFFLSFSMQAQKIALVDVNEVLEDLSDYRNAQSEIDNISAKWRQEISLEMDEVKSMYNKFQAEQVLLSDDIKRQREDEIMAKGAAVRELQKRRFGPDGDLFRKRQELISPVQDKVFAAIEDLASDRGYDIILDKAGSAGILFANDDYDKTEEVKRRLGIR